jgi:hypothetical protein
MNICVQIYMCKYTRANICVQIYVCKYMCANICVQIYVCKYMCANICVQIYVCKCMFANVCVQMYVCRYLEHKIYYLLHRIHETYYLSCQRGCESRAVTCEQKRLMFEKYILYLRSGKMHEKYIK